jgi:hypothetical protein
MAMLGAFGCSDPVPAAAAVGLRLTISNSGSCPTTVADDDIGNPPPDSTGAGSGTRVYDGEAGVQANCSVSGSGPFTVSGQIASDPKGLSFVVSGANVSADGTGTANIAISSRSSPGSVATIATPCTLTVVKTSTGLQVKPGAIWATFVCPKLEDPPGTSCFAFGEFVLENCRS